MFHRGFQGSRRRSTLRPMVNTYKKVLHFVNASFGAGFTNDFLVQGQDNISPKQTSNVDGAVPTGSRIKFIEVQFAAANNVATPIYVNCTLQYKLGGQAFIDPNTVGGHNQRNQVLHMDLFSVGNGQNSTHKFKFKIPKKFQRVREGMDWALVWRTNGTLNRELQAIYKFEH